MRFGTVIDPMFASPDSDQIVGYTRCGDSAIWTGHYLAAEAFQYAVSPSPAALANVNTALAGLRSLVDITGNRSVGPLPGADYIRVCGRNYSGEGAQWRPCIHARGGHIYWIGRTSRDQYCGVFFGLAIAFDLAPNAELRSAISGVGTRLLNFLLRNNWNVVMPDGSISTTFAGRPDQQLTLLQIGRRINPSRFGTTYSLYRFFQAGTVPIPISTEVLDDHNSFFKFNLDTINL